MLIHSRRHALPGTVSTRSGRRRPHHLLHYCVCWLLVVPVARFRRGRVIDTSPLLAKRANQRQCRCQNGVGGRAARLTDLASARAPLEGLGSRRFLALNAGALSHKSAGPGNPPPFPAVATGTACRRPVSTSSCRCLSAATRLTAVIGLDPTGGSGRGPRRAVAGSSRSCSPAARQFSAGAGLGDGWTKTRSLAHDRYVRRNRRRH